MKSAVETLEPTRARLTVEVSFEDLKPSLDAAYQRIAKQVNVPGFRKGKVPPPVIDRQFGRGVVLDEAVNAALPVFYAQALQDNDLVPLAQPEIDITRLEDNESLEFTAEVDIRPTITLPEYRGLEASVDDLAVADSDVEEQLQSLRERFATLSDVDRAVEDGDFVTIDLTATQDGEPVDGGELADYSYHVGPSELLPGLDELLIGMSAGEEQTYTTQLVGGEMAGEDVDVAVTVKSVKAQQLDDLNDDFAQTASEFDTLAELTEDTRGRLERSKRLEQGAAARDAVLQVLIDATDVPLPEKVVADELAGRRAEMEQQLNYAGMTLESYLDDQKQTVDEFEADLEKRVRDSLIAQFVLDEVAKAEQIGVEQEELSEHLWRRAQQSGQDPNQYVQHMMEHNHLPELVSEVRRGKALALIVNAAQVSDASGEHVELERLRGDGTIGDPESDDAVETDEAEVADAEESDAEE